MSTIDVITKSRPRLVPIDISSGRVYILTMTGAERHQIVIRNVSQPNNPHSDAEIAAIALCEEDGRKCFPVPEAGVPACMQMDAADLRTIGLRVLRESNIATTPQEQEEIEKKS